MSMREHGRRKAEEWAGVLHDFADDVYSESGEEGSEAFWSRLIEILLDEHDRFRAEYDAHLESRAARFDEDFVRLIERGDLLGAVEGFVHASSLNWRQALVALRKVCFKHLVPDEVALEASALLVLLRCPPAENPKLHAVRLYKERGKRMLDDAIRDVDELVVKYRLASTIFPSGTERIS